MDTPFAHALTNGTLEKISWPHRRENDRRVTFYFKANNRSYSAMAWLKDANFSPATL